MNSADGIITSSADKTAFPADAEKSTHNLRMICGLSCPLARLELPHALPVRLGRIKDHWTARILRAQDHERAGCARSNEDDIEDHP
ncbi:MAG TPA: hypothetical protein VK630_14820, partial [Reyranella sp.]|nr:hypothetical protein [Reyranella sp.]